MKLENKKEPLLVHLNPFSMNPGSVPVGAASYEEQLSVVLIPDMTQTWLRSAQPQEIRVKLDFMEKKNNKNNMN